MMDGDALPSTSFYALHVNNVGFCPLEPSFQEEKNRIVFVVFFTLKNIT